MTNIPDVADLVDQLCDPHQHVERIHFWDDHRNRKTREHRTTQPGLLTQLAELMLPGGDPDAGSSVAISKPPGRWDATATHATITLEALRWCWNLRHTIRDTVEGSLRSLLGGMPAMDHDQRADLTADVRRWHRSALIVTGWRTPPMDPRAPCPAISPKTERECRERTLRINLTESQAFCGTCGTAWDETTIGLLAEHVRAYKATADAAAAAARDRAREAKGNAA